MAGIGVIELLIGGALNNSDPFDLKLDLLEEQFQFFTLVSGYKVKTGILTPTEKDLNCIKENTPLTLLPAGSKIYANWRGGHYYFAE